MELYYQDKEKRVKRKVIGEQALTVHATMLSPRLQYPKLKKSGEFSLRSLSNYNRQDQQSEIDEVP
jgi:hypothetical protein